MEFCIQLSAVYRNEIIIGLICGAYGNFTSFCLWRCAYFQYFYCLPRVMLPSVAHPGLLRFDTFNVRYFNFYYFRLLFVPFFLTVTKSPPLNFIFLS